MSRVNLDEIVRAYLEAQLWAQPDYDRDECGCHPTLDANYGIADIAPEYVETLRAELADVVQRHADLVSAYHATIDRPERAQWSRSELFGHDFYLTREGHGTGFWDRGLGELGDKLTTVADSYGEASELADDGTGVLR